MSFLSFPHQYENGDFFFKYLFLVLLCIYIRGYLGGFWNMNDGETC